MNRQIRPSMTSYHWSNVSESFILFFFQRGFHPCLILPIGFHFNQRHDNHMTTITWCNHYYRRYFDIDDDDNLCHPSVQSCTLCSYSRRIIPIQDVCINIVHRMFMMIGKCKKKCGMFIGSGRIYVKFFIPVAKSFSFYNRKKRGNWI